MFVSCLCHVIPNMCFILILLYSAKFWLDKTWANQSFQSLGEENVSKFIIANIEVLHSARLSLNGFSLHRFSQDSLAFSAILRVNGIGRSMAKTIVTIAI